MTNKNALCTCKNGHPYFKSSNRPVCPVCEKQRQSKMSLFSSLSAPARRALEHKNIDTLQKLSECGEKEILQLHGIGKTTIPKLLGLLNEAGLQFKEISK